MEFKIKKNQLVNALGTVIGAVNPRSPLPVLSNVLLETTTNGLRLSATDLEIGVSTEVEAEILKEGVITVPARKLYEVARELPDGEVYISVTKSNAVNIKTDKTHCRVIGLGREDFPNLPELSSENAFELDQEATKECLGLTAFAISHDETRHVLNGVLISIQGGKIRFIATDGRRLAYVEKVLEGENTKPIEFIIPAKTVTELNKILVSGKLQILHSQNQVAFVVGKTKLTSRLIEGRFPNYEQVIPKEEITLGSVSRQAFLSAIRRASLFTSQDTQAVKFDFVKDKILVSSHSPNLGEVREEIDAKVNGEDVSIGFNPIYLLDALKSLDSEEVSISLTKPDKPGLLKSRDNYLYVVMPMQLP